MGSGVICWEKARDARRDLLEKLNYPYWLVGISIDPRGTLGYYLEILMFHDSAKIPFEHMGVPIHRRRAKDSDRYRVYDTWKSLPPLAWEDV